MHGVGGERWVCPFVAVCCQRCLLRHSFDHHATVPACPCRGYILFSGLTPQQFQRMYPGACLEGVRGGAAVVAQGRRCTELYHLARPTPHPSHTTHLCLPARPCLPACSHPWLTLQGGASSWTLAPHTSGQA